MKNKTTTTTFITVCLLLTLILFIHQLPLVKADPTTFTSVNVTSVHTCPLDEHTFVVAYLDATNNDVSFQIWDTNGTQIIAETDVDTTVASVFTMFTSVGVSAFNSTHFVIGWYNINDQDATFSVYKSDGSLVAGPIDADTDVGSGSCSVSVSAFNSTHFVIGWYDQTDYDITFSVYTSSGTLVAGSIDADTDVGSGSCSVSVSAFNSTHFVIGWYDDSDYDATFSVYKSDGSLVAGPIDADTDVGIGCFSVSVSTFNSTHFVIGWYDYTDCDATFSVYKSDGSLVAGPIDADTNIGSGSYSVSVSAFNSTHFVIGWYDDSDYDLTFAIYGSDGTVICSATDIESWATSSNSPFRYQSPCSQETATGISIYGDNWIIAYANTTSQAIWRAYKPDGTEWDGIVPTEDTEPPTYSNVATNTTVAGAYCQFSILWNDNVNVSGYVFGTNNTDSWVNDTWVSFTVFYNSTAAWSNITKTLNSAGGVTIAWQVWCNDTSNNWNTTGTQYLTTTLGIYPFIYLADYELNNQLKTQNKPYILNSTYPISSLNYAPIQLTFTIEAETLNTATVFSYTMPILLTIDGVAYPNPLPSKEAFDSYGGNCWYQSDNILYVKSFSSSTIQITWSGYYPPSELPPVTPPSRTYDLKIVMPTIIDSILYTHFTAEITIINPTNIADDVYVTWQFLDPQNNTVSFGSITVFVDAKSSETLFIELHFPRFAESTYRLNAQLFNITATQTIQLTRPTSTYLLIIFIALIIIILIAKLRRRK